MRDNGREYADRDLAFAVAAEGASPTHVADFTSFPWFHGTTRYKGTCSCGWIGHKTENQADARNEAVDHAQSMNESASTSSPTV